MTDRHSIETIVAAALHQLRIDLDGHHQVVDLSEWEEQRVRSAIEWLLAVRSDEGYWGYRSPAVTATCCIAIALWRPVEAETLLRRSAEWLLSLADDDGAWETIWDTAAALTAVFAAGAGDDPRARTAMRRLAGQDPDGCEARPHHAAQVIAAAQKGHWSPAKKERWCVRMARTLDLDAGAYVVGQTVYGLLSAGRPVGDLGEPLSYLADYLQRTPVSSAAFLDHAAALRALARAGSHPEVVDRTIDDLFGSAHRLDGSWYHEPWYSAWALLALHEANAVRRVVVEQPRLDEYLARLDRMKKTVGSQEAQQLTEEHRTRWKVAGLAALGLVSLAGAGFAVFMVPDSNRLFTSGVAVSLSLGAVAVAGGGLWPLLRPGGARP